MSKRGLNSLLLLMAISAVGAVRGAEKPDAVVIGAGISGLSVALEAARGGKRVVIIEISTVGGGHAVMSSGAVALVGTPLQRKQQIDDSPPLAERDFMMRGEDANRDWVKRYARDSKTWLYDWFTSLGVEFDVVLQTPGNSVPRLHRAKDKGIGLVGPLLTECLRHPNIEFEWATKAEDLILDGDSVIGVLTRNVRSGKTRRLEARAIIIATGGFAANLDLVRRTWPTDLPSPPRLLVGGSHFATATGHEMAVRAGGILTAMDHQWSYVFGLPDPRDHSGERGLAAFSFQSIWVNRRGERFAQEFGDPKSLFPALLRQPEAAYWSIFDSKARDDFTITLAGYDDRAEVEELVYGSQALVERSETVEGLAAAIGVPAEALSATIERYNEQVRTGIDGDYGRFGPGSDFKPEAVDKAPFYAAPFFPITRKSMGGIAVDESARVLRADGRPIGNLYAVGEAAGFGGINGSAALEGTFLGPAAYMGRVVGGVIGGEESAVEPDELRPVPTRVRGTDHGNGACLGCHQLEADVQAARPGYWHFEQSHARVLSRGFKCVRCHTGKLPFDAAAHKLDRIAQTLNCVACHASAAERSAFR